MIPIALAADTVSIAVMEIVDNLIMVAVPGAMERASTPSCSGAASPSPCSSPASSPFPSTAG